MIRKSGPKVQGNKLLQDDIGSSLDPFPEQKVQNLQKNALDFEKTETSDSEEELLGDPETGKIALQDEAHSSEDEEIIVKPDHTFKSSEGKFSEELAYQNSRKKRFSELDKKQRHLLLFTNYDQLNFVNIN